MYVEGWNVHRVVRPSRLANAVIERLLLRILDGEFQPGGDLPPEAALAQEFAVSRTILREALKALEEKRVLRIRHGRGTTVRPKADWNILDPLVLSVLLEYGGSATLATELDEVRTALHLLMADLAAQRIEPEQRDALDLAIGRMRACLPSDVSPGDVLSYREAAHQFGKILAEASCNEVARCVVETIDVPAPEAALEDELAAMAKTQEFAERLYARIVRGTDAARGIESPAVQYSAPVAEDLTRREMAAAEPNASNASGLPLPNQSPLRTQQLRRRPGVELRPTMVGAGSGTRSLL
ncbi:MAG TPA: GntR family transcriptional regulator [Actinocrinis sp.]|jgi:DNA-binding FadR family transcriptional regulator|uniref:FadR/GntR family transcriptional regulator n=1 Tax=Actinocrinis sp. TaxID=1920516 RepID=UPI002D7410ED|nr:GntR family transcriptional regulator [Actinocrinis sp.]HZU55236.1 GntR family transcriptional regulator [Actinocrinis sp.]